MNRQRSNRYLVALALALSLVGCRDTDAPQSRAGESSLEIAAREAGVIANSAMVDPMGSYARRHENGFHEICIGPEAGKSRAFGMIADLGTGLSCQGRGRVSDDGDALRFVFDDHEDCAIEARYDGEGIRLPGRLPSACAAMCTSRATVAGLSVERSGWSRDDARTVRARHDAKGIVKGDPLCD